MLYPQGAPKETKQSLPASHDKQHQEGQARRTKSRPLQWCVAFSSFPLAREGQVMTRSSRSRRSSNRSSIGLGTQQLVVALLLLLLPIAVVANLGGGVFRRIATLKICEKLDNKCNNDTETVAEIIDITPDGRTLVYTDSTLREIGIIDLTDPQRPIHAFRVSVDGEPTSVAVTNDGQYAVAVVNTSPNFVNTTGLLYVINLSTAAIVAKLDLPGQPDSIKVAPSPYHRLAIVIENERDEDLNDGALPQRPAGSLILIDTTDVDRPQNWNIAQVVNLTYLYDGMAFPSDPEPEYVDINGDGVAVVSLQENNGLVLINVTDGTIVRATDAGTVDLVQIDATEDMIVSQTEKLLDVPREPDAVVWLGPKSQRYFATADEGDLNGGSRGFTIFDSTDLSVVYTSGNELDHMAARVGHYNEDRSENKGNEPEGLAFGTYGNGTTDLLFVLSERSNLCFVYDVTNDPTQPRLLQTLPTGVGPEAAKAIPSRNLLVVASEVDNRADKIRAGLTIYEYDVVESTSSSAAFYPSVVSVDRADGSPIPFAALSGLACGGEWICRFAVVVGGTW
jgi:hypothetical protein